VNVDRLSPFQQRLLEWLAHPIDDDHDGEVVTSKGQAWIGTTQVSMHTVYSLLWLCCLRDETDGPGLRRYTINGTGRDLLAGYFSVAQLRQAIHAGKPFMPGTRGIEFL
jgi:hypothetical protein